MSDRCWVGSCKDQVTRDVPIGKGVTIPNCEYHSSMFSDERATFHTTRDGKLRVLYHPTGELR